MTPSISFASIDEPSDDPVAIRTVRAAKMLMFMLATFYAVPALQKENVREESRFQENSIVAL